MSPPGGSLFGGHDSAISRPAESQIGHPTELGRFAASELPNARNLPVPSANDFTNAGALSMLNNGFHIFDPSTPINDQTAANVRAPFDNAGAAAGSILSTVMNGILDTGPSASSQQSNDNGSSSGDQGVAARTPVGMNSMMAQAWTGWADDPTAVPADDPNQSA